MVIWKLWGRKRSWRNLRYYPSICAKDLGKTSKNQSRQPVSGPKFEPYTSEIRSRNANHSPPTFGTYSVCFITCLTTLFKNVDIFLSEKIIANDEWERIWKEAIVEYFKVLTKHSPSGIEKNHEKHKSHQTSNQRSPKFEISTKHPLAVATQTLKPMSSNVSGP
jgi:hypothetical protein